ncbi:MAG TPA: hypothetical protein DHW02_01440 [Ktedonobacter sp.]|nr:hypothetical protein [Ktedonobacter sp.]
MEALRPASPTGPLSTSKISNAVTVTIAQPTSPTGDDPLRVSREKLYQHDPLMRLFRSGKNPLNEYAIVLAMGVLTVAVLFGGGYLFSLYFHNGRLDIQYVLRSAIQSAVVFPWLIFLYLRMPGDIASLFNEIHDNGVIGEPLKKPKGPTDYAMFVTWLTNAVDKWWWMMAALAFIVLYTIYRLVVVYLSPANATPLGFEIINTLNNDIIMYCIVMTLARLLTALVYSNVLFRNFMFHLNILHPDGAGGLGSIEDILWTSAGLLVAMGIAGLVMNTSFLSGNFTPYSLGEAIIVGVLYLSLVPTLLFGWLFLPHKVMSDAHDETLQPLSNQFQYTVDDDVPTQADDSTEIKHGTDRLDELKRRYDLIDKNFPVWPVQRFVRLLSTMSIPAAITFVGSLPGIYNNVYAVVIRLFH